MSLTIPLAPNSGLYSIETIKSWLSTHLRSYREIHNHVYSQHLYEMSDGSIARLPPTIKPEENEKFLILYEALNTLADLHQYEIYFQNEIQEYIKIKNQPQEEQNWLKKNEILGSEKLVCFLIDYLDYDESPFHLKVYVHSSEEIEIFINNKDFLYTLEFLKIFNDLYYKR